MIIKKLNNKMDKILKIKDVAYQKMMCYTNSVKTEIGWLGTATKEGNEYFIHDVYLLEQQVHGATAELTTDGISKLLYDELASCDDIDFILDNMKVWGHSHNTMSTNPSLQDDKQMEIFEDGGHDFFIRLITNHKGEINVTIYDYVNGLIYDGLEWLIKYDEDTMEELEKLESQMEYLQVLYDAHKYKSKIDEGAIKREIKTKVSEIKYGYGNNVYNGYNSYKNYGNTNNVKKNETIEEKLVTEADYIDKLYDDESNYIYDPYLGYLEY